jgi:hypothetical protein
MTVRDLLLKDQRHIANDLSNRQLQWAQTSSQPSGLPETATAYRCAGFGPHECILYFGMVQCLIDTYRSRLEPQTFATDDIATEVAWLRERRDEWLWHKDDCALMGKTPNEVIDSERRRIPLIVENHHDVLHDDCPICQMMASEENGPMFWELDSSPRYWKIMDEGGPNADDDDDDDDDEIDDELEEEVDNGVDDNELEEPVGPEPNGAGVPYSNSAVTEASAGSSQDLLASAGWPPMDPIWSRVCILTQPGEVSPEVDLFAVAACTGELIEDLKARTAERECVDTLNRHIGNLSSALRNGEISLLGPVVTRFCDCLDDIGLEHADLAEKVDDLQSRLVGLVQAAEGPGPK